MGLDLHRIGRNEEALVSLSARTKRPRTLGAADARLVPCQRRGASTAAWGTPAVASAWADRAVDEIAHLGWDLAEGEGARSRASLARSFEIGILAACRQGDAGAVYRFLEQGRAGTLLAALGGRNAIRCATIPESLRKAEDEARAAEILAVAAIEESLRAGRRRELRERTKKLPAVRAQVEKAVASIQRAERLASHLVLPTIAQPREVQALLNSGDALVLYGVALGEGLALVLTRDTSRIVGLGPQDPVRDALEALAYDARPETRGRLVIEETPAPAAAVDGALDRLRAALVEPLKLGPDVRRLLVSPGAAFSGVPFRVLLGERDLVQVPSATTYVHLRGLPRVRGASVLALGNPAYDRTLDAAGRARRFLPLPGTKPEVEAIGDRVLLGAEASETRLRQALREEKTWKAVHLACHGAIDVDHPALSSLALAADDENDGLLTTLEIFELELPAELVVLSGCETGLGEVVAGEGIIGFTRAVMFAGAPRVLVSLWPVDDDATQGPMTTFYELWNPAKGGSGTRWRRPFASRRSAFATMRRTPSGRTRTTGRRGFSGAAPTESTHRRLPPPGAVAHDAPPALCVHRCGHVVASARTRAGKLFVKLIAARTRVCGTPSRGSTCSWVRRLTGCALPGGISTNGAPFSVVGVRTGETSMSSLRFFSRPLPVFLLVFALTPLLAREAGADTYEVWKDWGGTWSDAEKTLANTDDDLLCWAAAASNILEWTGWGAVDGMSTTDQMFAHYQSHFSNQGGNPYYAWDWWFDGTNDVQGESGWAQQDVVGGGGFWPNESIDDYRRWSGDDATAMATIDSWLHDGYGTTIHIAGPGAHLISVWGFDTDDDGNYTGLWVTDSDDSKDGNGTRPNLLQYYDVELESGQWFLQSYWGSDPGTSTR